MSLEACPKCGADSVFLPLVPAAGYDGKLYGGRSEGFCNSPQCDQLLWYYPRSGRVTRRNTGVTLREYRLRRADIKVINAMRLNEGLPMLYEPDSEEVEPIRLDGFIEIDKEPRLTILRRGLRGWYEYLRAAVMSPFRKRLPEPPLTSLGIQTINDGRVKRGLDPINEVPDDDKGPCMVDGRYHDKE